MIQRFSGIVLCTLKYNDTKNIVNVYTEQNGRMSFLSPARRSGKSLAGNLLFRPLSLVEFDADVKSSSALSSIKETWVSHPLVSIPYNPFKSGIALFLADFLYFALKKEGCNEALYAYVSNSIKWLDTCDDGFANFHLVFLMRLSRFLGLYPNVENYTEGDYFDLINACFTTERPLHGMYVHPEEASRIVNLMRMRYDTMRFFRMNRTERNRCIEIICEYYSLHLPEFPHLKSLSVLKELFS